MDINVNNSERRRMASWASSKERWLWSPGVRRASVSRPPSASTPKARGCSRPARTQPRLTTRARNSTASPRSSRPMPGTRTPSVRCFRLHVAERAGWARRALPQCRHPLGGGGSIVDMPEEAFDAVLRVNLKGPWLALKAAIPLLRRGGAVVLNGSINGHLGMPGTSAYAASKGALRSLARVAASELAPTRRAGQRGQSGAGTKSGIVEKLMGAEAAAAEHAEARSRDSPRSHAVLRTGVRGCRRLSCQRQKALSFITCVWRPASSSSTAA